MRKLLFMIVFSLATAAAFAQDDEITLTEPVLSDEEVEAIQFAKPSDEVLAKLNRRLELLVFTRKNTTSCHGCEIAQEAIRRAEKLYPITKVHVDTIKGRHEADLYEVDGVPTFILVQRTRKGEADELVRWTGARTPNDVVSRIEREFARHHWNVDDPGLRPTRDPRPLPDPKPRPKPESKPRPETPPPTPQPPRRSLWDRIFD